MNNHVLENLITLCEDDGIETFLSNDSNNVLAGNVAFKNGGFGMEIWGDNNLLADNVLIGNRLGGISVGQGSSSVAVGNLVKNSGSRGCFLLNHTNLFFGENKVEANLREGIAVLSDFPNGIFQQNKTRHNTDSGITLGPDAQANFVFNNKLECNIPVNIRDAGVNNNFFGNIDEPCKPNELPLKDCADLVRNRK